MKIPKKIDKLLKRRNKLAWDLNSAERELDEWLESKGFDLNDPSLNEGILTSCMVYCEPDGAEQIVRDFLEGV